MCATCHVYVDRYAGADPPEVGEDEDEMLDCTSEDRLPNSRLGCQLFAGPEVARIEVTLPESQI
ncbi:Rhodocoxin [Leucobacter soli]|uniref:Rhodocoxin n=2 Tax=Leucobacter soli TaxID=2812850 RepID=A0A916JWS9_9MICO|nr:Rhodocoxin [Leucobacter soli]